MLPQRMQNKHGLPTLPSHWRGLRGKRNGKALSQWHIGPERLTCYHLCYGQTSNTAGEPLANRGVPLQT